MISGLEDSEHSLIETMKARPLLLSVLCYQRFIQFLNLRHFDIIEKVEYEAYNKLSILSLKW